MRQRAGIDESFGMLWGLLRGEHLTPHTGAIAFQQQDGAPHPFTAHYTQYVMPMVQQFEQRRMAQLRLLRERLKTALLIAICAVFLQITMHFFVLSAEDVGLHKFLLFLALPGYGMLLYWLWGPVRQYKAAVKGDVFPQIFRYYNTAETEPYQYHKEGLLSMKALKPSGIVPSYDKAQIEDYVKGHYKGVSLELQEAHLTKKQGSGKSRRTVTTFKGLVVRLAMNKPFQGHTVIRKDHGKVGNWFADKFSSKGRETVALEDPEFEKLFEVSSTDQVEARYLLTTSFMQRLLELAQLCGGKGLQAAFYEDQLLLMIPSDKNRFEVASIFTPATFEEEIQTILAEMQEIFEVIDLLKLFEQTRL